jgi:hypothetical protein
MDQVAFISYTAYPLHTHYYYYTWAMFSVGPLYAATTEALHSIGRRYLAAALITERVSLTQCAARLAYYCRLARTIILDLALHFRDLEVRFPI